MFQSPSPTLVWGDRWVSNPRVAGTCPYRRGTVRAIRIVNRQHGGGHGPLEYAAIDARPGLWLSELSVEGEVRATMCQSCGGIFLFGARYATQEELEARKKKRSRSAGRLTLSDPSGQGGLTEPDPET